MTGRAAVYSRPFASLMRPSTAANGIATSAGNSAVRSIDNPDCGTATTGNGWQLTTITNTAAGLPATIAGPLSIP